MQHMVDEVNKRFPYPIQVKTIQLNILPTSPQLKLILHEVAILNPLEATTHLLMAHKVHCSFDLCKLLKKQYILNQLHIEQGEVCLVANQPYQCQPIGQATKEGQHNNDLLPISLSKVTLKDMEIIYQNPSKHQHYVIHVEQAHGRLQLTQQGLQADLKGKTLIQNIQLRDFVSNNPIPVVLHAKVSYDYPKQLITLHATQLIQKIGTIGLQGHLSSKENGLIDLVAKGHHVALESILWYFPKQIYQPIAPYQPQGEISFNLKINKKPNNRTVSIQGDWGLQKGSLSVKYLAQPLTIHPLVGQLCIPNINDLRTASMHLEEFTTTLASSQLIGKLSIKNFYEFYLEYCTKAALDASLLAKIFSIPLIPHATGRIMGHWKITTNLKQLRHSKSTDQAIQCSGTLQTQGVNFQFQQIPCSLQDQKSSMHLEDGTLIMKNFTGRFGSGNFVLNGTLKNLFSGLLSNEQNCYLNAKLYTDYLALDDLIPSKQTHAKPTLGQIAIAPSWVINLACDIQELHYKRFQSKRLQGKLSIKDQQIIADNVHFGVSNGHVSLNAMVDISTDTLCVSTHAKLQRVQIDSLFYIFENFHQTFLEDKHLGGIISADVDLDMQANRLGYIDWNTLRADMTIHLSNAVLNNFAPMQRLAKYVSEESLADLRFTALKNNIQIKNRTIYIPPMHIYSNIIPLKISGTHTFDGKIAYNFVVPLAHAKESINPLSSEELTNDAFEGMNLHLKLQGYTHDYQITHDVEALKTDLKDKLRQQGGALKALFQGKYGIKKTIQELDLDDYLELD